MTTTRGIRNNNPGNIRKGKDKWQGLAKEQPDASFCTFIDPTWGIRAIARILITYQDKHGTENVAEIISRWAPNTENDTQSYINTVCREIKRASNTHFDCHKYADLAPLIAAIISVECAGYRYPAAVLSRGLVLAGVVAPKPPIVAAPQVKAATVAAGLTTASALADQINQFTPAVETVTSLATYAPLAVAILAIGAVGWFIWREIQQRRVGL